MDLFFFPPGRGGMNKRKSRKRWGISQRIGDGIPDFSYQILREKYFRENLLSVRLPIVG